MECRFPQIALRRRKPRLYQMSGGMPVQLLKPARFDVEAGPFYLNPFLEEAEKPSPEKEEEAACYAAFIEVR